MILQSKQHKEVYNEGFCPPLCRTPAWYSVPPLPLILLPCVSFQIFSMQTQAMLIYILLSLFFRKKKACIYCWTLLVFFFRLVDLEHLSMSCFFFSCIVFHCMDTPIDDLFLKLNFLFSDNCRVTCSYRK